MEKQDISVVADNRFRSEETCTECHPFASVVGLENLQSNKFIW